MNRKELRDRQDKYDTYWSKKGQEEAKRYLKSKEVPATRGNIRAGIAFMLLSIATLVILLAL